MLNHEVTVICLEQAALYARLARQSDGDAEYVYNVEKSLYFWNAFITGEIPQTEFPREKPKSEGGMLTQEQRQALYEASLGWLMKKSEQERPSYSQMLSSTFGKTMQQIAHDIERLHLGKLVLVITLFFSTTQILI